MSSKTYSTEEAARAVGISRATLYVWIAKRKVAAPKPKTLGGLSVRVWTVGDVAGLRKAKAQVYWKGQGRPRKNVRRRREA